MHRTIVLDTAAFIAGTDSLYTLGGIIDADTKEYVHDSTTTSVLSDSVTFYTIPEVIHEVRDARARERLVLLNDILKVRAPSSEALAAVISFSKATGDYSVLSLTDLKVMALCRMLEKERDGGKYLKEQPQKKSYTQIRCGRLIPMHKVEQREQKLKQRREEEMAKSDGWTTVDANITTNRKPKPKAKSKKKKNKSNFVIVNGEVKELNQPDDIETDNNENNFQDNNPTSNGDGEEDLPTIDTDSATDTITSKAVHTNETLPKNLERTEKAEKSLNQLTAAVDSLAIVSTSQPSADEPTKVKDESLEHPPTEQVDSIEQTEERESNTEETNNLAENEEGVDSDDGEGWINGDNLQSHLNHDSKVSAPTKEDEIRTGCVTTDFAMQNSMIQMGLKILTVDGRRTIKKIKHFAIRCSACGSITRELNMKFCQACGNFQTLHRVAFTVSKNGTARAYVNPKRMKPSLRGTKYSIPKQKGGRNPTDLILRPDQIDPVKQRRIEKQLQNKNVDVLDPTTFYNAGVKFDPKNAKPLVVGYGRRNPNQVKASSRSKKR